MKYPKIKYTTYEAGLVQAQAYRALQSFMNSQLACVDLTMIEWALLGTINDHTGSNGQSTSELSKALDVELPRITKLTHSLLDKELIVLEESDPDKRVHRFRLTAKGQTLVASTEQKLRKAMKIWLSDISLRDLRAYMKVLHILASK